MVKIEIESKTTEKALELASSFLQKLIGPSVEEIGGIFADNWRALRIKNELRLIQNTEKYVSRKGIKVKKIPLKLLAPLLNGAALEEDEILQNKWVSLLVNYIDSNRNFNSTVFPYILTQISTDEANGLEYIKGKEEVRGREIWDKLKFSDVELSNLVRLGLIRIIIKIETERKYHERTGTGENVIGVYIEEEPTYCITELGIEFLKACMLKD